MTGIDEIIHQPVRLRIMSALASLPEGDQMEFTYLRDLLKLTDGNLSVHLTKLEQADYVGIDKEFVGKKPRTFIRVTGTGRDAFHRYVESLKGILSGKKQPPL